MRDEGVSALAVVDEAGHLTGNLSASDLRCLAPGLFAALLLPVDEYLSKRPLLQRVQAELRSVNPCERYREGGGARERVGLGR